MKMTWLYTPHTNAIFFSLFFTRELGCIWMEIRGIREKKNILRVFDLKETGKRKIKKEKEKMKEKKRDIENKVMICVWLWEENEKKASEKK